MINNKTSAIKCDERIRILQVCGNLSQACGISQFLINIARNLDWDRFQMDFICIYRPEGNDLEKEIRSLGGNIFYCKKPSSKLTELYTFIATFMNILEKNGPYDAVHSNLWSASALILLLCRMKKICVRIAHSHSTPNENMDNLSKVRHKLMGWLLKQNATQLLAVSKNAGQMLYGNTWNHDSRAKVLYNGIDLNLFRKPVNKQAVRSELGIPCNAYIIGTVGRCSPEKNHIFLIDLLFQIRLEFPNTHLLIIGDGPEKQKLIDKAAQLQLEKYITFTGVRNDVPRLLLGAMDLFVFPSLREGFGIGVVEAQAAGLPCLISDEVPKEVDVGADLVSRLSLSSATDVWCNTLKKMRNREYIVTDTNLMDSTLFNIVYSVHALEHIYANTPTKHLN